MDINEIQSLIKFVSKSGVSEVELETKGFKIVIKTGNNRVNEQPIYIQAPPAVQSVPVQAPINTQAAVETPSPAPETPKPATAPSNNYVTVKSPMIGTFYRSSSPDKAPFVNVGDEIKSGDVLCIIEAMKLFNEIESEVSGKIVKVLIDDSKPVEYDQPLFLVEPA
jgi:acetyl-CoA carboxylase biotin carboxyl carrier protein